MTIRSISYPLLCFSTHLMLFNRVMGFPECRVSFSVCFGAGYFIFSSLTFGSLDLRGWGDSLFRLPSALGSCVYLPCHTILALRLHALAHNAFSLFSSIVSVCYWTLIIQHGSPSLGTNLMSIGLFIIFELFLFSPSFCLSSNAHFFFLNTGFLTTRFSCLYLYRIRATVSRL